MALSAAAKALALLLFLAAIGAATYGVNEALGLQVEGQPVAFRAVQLERSATPGHTVSYLVSIENRGATERQVVVELSGVGNGRSDPVSIPANNSLAVFVPVTVAEDAPVGSHPLTLRVLSGDATLRARDDAVRLTILPATPGLEVGDRAEILYVGRLAETGRAFATNDPALVGVNFLKTENYQFSQAKLPLSTAPRNVVLGLYEGALGMQPGETRTLTFGYEKAYGPPSENTTLARHDVIERTLVADNDVQRVPRQTFDEYIVESGQGDPSTFGVGSTFRLEEDQNVWPYRLTNITSQVVEYKLDARVGDRFTLYPYWANASEIRAINDTSVEFYTTPTTPAAPEGACPPRTATSNQGCFTMRQEWPDMSTVDGEFNETHVTIRHDPPPNFRYTIVQNGQTREIVVAELRDDEIVVAVAASHPLAGKALTFDVTMLTLTKAPASS